MVKTMGILRIIIYEIPGILIQKGSKSRHDEFFKVRLAMTRDKMAEVYCDKDSGEIIGIGITGLTKKELDDRLEIADNEPEKLWEEFLNIKGLRELTSEEYNKWFNSEE